MKDNETIKLMDFLENIDDEKKLDKYLKDLQNLNENLDFINYFVEILSTKSISKSALIKNSNLDRTYAYQILNGTKKGSRDKILCLCIAANLTLKESNKSLKLCGYNELYAKDIRDSIIIFGINNKLDLMTLNDFLYDKGFDTL